MMLLYLQLFLADKKLQHSNKQNKSVSHLGQNPENNRKICKWFF